MQESFTLWFAIHRGAAFWILSWTPSTPHRLLLIPTPLALGATSVEARAVERGKSGLEVPNRKWLQFSRMSLPGCHGAYWWTSLPICPCFWVRNLGKAHSLLLKVDSCILFYSHGHELRCQLLWTGWPWVRDKCRLGQNFLLLSHAFAITLFHLLAH